MYTLRQPPSFTLFPYTTLFRSPQIVQAAEQTADTAVTSIIAEISGGEKKPYKGKYDGFMVSIGARYGVAKDRKSTRLNSSHVAISYAVFCLKKKKVQIKTLRLL